MRMLIRFAMMRSLWWLRRCLGTQPSVLKRAKQRLEEHGYEVLYSMQPALAVARWKRLSNQVLWQVCSISRLLNGQMNWLAASCEVARIVWEAAARHGVPAIVTPGCLDMVNFGERASIPDKFKDRIFYQHNPQITLMRTTAEECEQLGAVIASKLNLSMAQFCSHFPGKRSA